MRRRCGPAALWDGLDGLGANQMLSNCQMNPCLKYSIWTETSATMTWLKKRCGCWGTAQVFEILQRASLWTVHQKAIYIQQIICLLGCVVWHGVQKCKLTEVPVSSPDTTAYLSPVSPLPDVHKSPNDVLSLSFPLTPVFFRTRMKLALYLTLKYVALVHKHTYAHIDTYT